MYWLIALVLPLVVNSAPVYVRILPQDCDEIYRSGTLVSGVYTIYPTEDTPLEVFCHLGCTDDPAGGWTVFQKRMDGSVSFYRTWNEYKNGFGNKSNEYWLGLENLYLLTRRKNYQLRVDLEDFDGLKAYALYTSFSVDSEATGYMLHVNGFVNGGAGDGLSYHNNQKFSTLDKDQDSAAISCARTYLGGFWYNACQWSNPNGVYIRGLDSTLFAIGNNWMPWKGFSYGLKTISMKLRPVQ